jgi:peptidoglycan/LPS O-acetylase OafA/YrhL
MVPGTIAVKLFFIISGFYMAMILCEKYTFHHGQFYKNRVLRLLPMYVATVILILLLGTATALLSGHSVNNSFSIFHAYRDDQLALSTAAFLLVSNLTMLFQDLVFFLAPSSDGTLTWAGTEQMAVVPFYSYLLIPQAWSLSLEIAFYLMAPVIIKRLDLILVAMIISIVVRLGLFAYGRDEEQFAYRFFPAELVFFLMGSLSYHLHKKFKVKRLAGQCGYWLVAVLVTICAYQIVPPQLEPGVRFGLYVALAVLIPYIFERSKDNVLDNSIGDLSYPFYILHMFVFSVLIVCASRFGVSTKGPLFLLAWIGGTLALSHAMLRVVQRPFDLIRKRNVQG